MTVNVCVWLCTVVCVWLGMHASMNGWMDGWMGGWTYTYNYIYNYLHIHTYIHYIHYIHTYIHTICKLISVCVYICAHKGRAASSFWLHNQRRSGCGALVQQQTPLSPAGGTPAGGNAKNSLTTSQPAPHFPPQGRQREGQLMLNGHGVCTNSWNCGAENTRGSAHKGRAASSFWLHNQRRSGCGALVQQQTPLSPAGGTPTGGNAKNSLTTSQPAPHFPTKTR